MWELLRCYEPQMCRNLKFLAYRRCNKTFRFRHIWANSTQSPIFLLLACCTPANFAQKVTFALLFPCRSATGESDIMPGITHHESTVAHRALPDHLQNRRGRQFLVNLRHQFVRRDFAIADRRMHNVRRTIPRHGGIRRKVSPSSMDAQAIPVVASGMTAHGSRESSVKRRTLVFLRRRDPENVRHQRARFRLWPLVLRTLLQARGKQEENRPFSEIDPSVSQPEVYTGVGW